MFEFNKVLNLVEYFTQRWIFINKHPDWAKKSPKDVDQQLLMYLKCKNMRQIIRQSANF